MHYKLERKVLYVVINKIYRCHNSRCFLITSYRFRPIQKQVSPNQIDQIALKQLKTSERQMFQNSFNTGSIQHVSSENRTPMRYVFWFES